ncbi:hypothetical protein C0993_010996 [Termitomyces sp. T159_Od127]|nr:hypothetical protein C0993_010996 [Termitomyces sp. T159_Od127]
MGLENQDELAHVPDIEERESDNLPLEEVLVEARRNLTDEQRTQIDRHMEKQKEPSQSKGKSVDPGNWGDIQFDEAEIDQQIQQDLIKDYHLRQVGICFLMGT